MGLGDCPEMQLLRYVSLFSLFFISAEISADLLGTCIGGCGDGMVEQGRWFCWGGQCC